MRAWVSGMRLCAREVEAATGLYSERSTELTQHLSREATDATRVFEERSSAIGDNFRSVTERALAAIQLHAGTLHERFERDILEEREDLDHLHLRGLVV